MVKEVIVLAKYTNFADIFLEKSANICLEQIRANKHIIELEQSKQPPYRPIYSLAPIELKNFKTYIKINLVNNFILVSKSPAGTPILFVSKPNNSFHECANYQELNNLKSKIVINYPSLESP